MPRRGSRRGGLRRATSHVAVSRALERGSCERAIPHALDLMLGCDVPADGRSDRG